MPELIAVCILMILLISEVLFPQCRCHIRRFLPFCFHRIVHFLHIRFIQDLIEFSGSAV